jgi:hypothetical protein
VGSEESTIGMSVKLDRIQDGFAQTIRHSGGAFVYIPVPDRIECSGYISINFDLRSVISGAANNTVTVQLVTTASDDDRSRSLRQTSPTGKGKGPAIVFHNSDPLRQRTRIVGAGQVHRRKAHSKNPAIVATNKIIAAATAAPTRLSSHETSGFVV